MDDICEVCGKQIPLSHARFIRYADDGSIAQRHGTCEDGMRLSGTGGMVVIEPTDED